METSPCPSCGAFRFTKSEHLHNTLNCDACGCPVIADNDLYFKEKAQKAMETKFDEKEELVLSDINTDGPELSCPYIDGVIRRFPETKATMEYIRTINAQLRHDADGYKTMYLELKSQLEEIKKDSDRFEGGLAAAMREISDKDKEIQALKEENESLQMSVDFLRGLRLSYEQRLGIDSSHWCKALSQGVKSDGN